MMKMAMLQKSTAFIAPIFRKYLDYCVKYYIPDNKTCRNTTFIGNYVFNE